MNNCKQCNKETKNAKFCSRSCAASYNNSRDVAPKRKLEGKCIKCNTAIPKGQKHCLSCKPEKPSIDDDKTLQDVIYEQHIIGHLHLLL